ncbi:unnamed protein product [Camellia sinensis]
MGGGGFQVMRRIPSIKFPLRYPKPSASGSAPRSDVPAAPINTAVGGQASLQPKRTPVTDREIEAVLIGMRCNSTEMIASWCCVGFWFALERARGRNLMPNSKI